MFCRANDGAAVAIEHSPLGVRRQYLTEQLAEPEKDIADTTPKPGVGCDLEQLIDLMGSRLRKYLTDER
jgi:hypothetical protein